mgnify:CR=1 FL=1
MTSRIAAPPGPRRGLGYAFSFGPAAVVRNEIGRNFACVDWIDRQLGRVFDKLEDPDGDGDVIFTTLPFNTCAECGGSVGVAAADFTGDGKLEIVQTAESRYRMIVEDNGQVIVADRHGGRILVRGSLEVAQRS